MIITDAEVVLYVSQNCLEEFIIKYHFRPINLNKILNPLIHQIHSLKSVQIYNRFINNSNMLKFLADCIQLQELRLNHVRFNYGPDILKNIKFHNLKTFHFNNIDFSEKVRVPKNLLSSVFANNKNLQEISLLINLKHYPNGLLQVISKNCKNLKRFTIEIRQESNILLLFLIMKDYQQLQLLFIPFGERTCSPTSGSVGYRTPDRSTFTRWKHWIFQSMSYNFTTMYFSYNSQ